MKSLLIAVMVSLMAVSGAALAAQAGTIEVQTPIGTNRTNGAKVKDGSSDNGDIITYTVRILAVGGDIDLINPVVEGGGYESVQVNIPTVPAAQTITSGNSVDFDVQIDPDKDSDWEFVITITSNATNHPSFTLRFSGTQGDPEEDDDDCSTSEGGGTSMLILLAALSAFVVSTRLRASRA